MELKRVDGDTWALTLTESQLKNLMDCFQASFRTLGPEEYPARIGARIEEGMEILDQLKLLFDNEI